MTAHFGTAAVHRTAAASISTSLSSFVPCVVTMWSGRLVTVVVRSASTQAPVPFGFSGRATDPTIYRWTNERGGSAQPPPFRSSRFRSASGDRQIEGSTLPGERQHPGPPGTPEAEGQRLDVLARFPGPDDDAAYI